MIWYVGDEKSNVSPKTLTKSAACECSLPKAPAPAGPPGALCDMLINTNTEYPTITAITASTPIVISVFLFFSKERFEA